MNLETATAEMRAARAAIKAEEEAIETAVQARLQQRWTSSPPPEVLREMTITVHPVLAGAPEGEPAPPWDGSVTVHVKAKWEHPRDLARLVEQIVKGNQ